MARICSSLGQVDEDTQACLYGQQPCIPHSGAQGSMELASYCSGECLLFLVVVIEQGSLLAG